MSRQGRGSKVSYLVAIEDLEAAVRQMQKGNYAKAAEILKKLADGPVQEVADRARIHLHNCERRLNPPANTPKSAEDLYNLGVFELNAHDLAAAIEHLSKAAKLKPGQEHIHYALAAAYALQGETDPAIEHLSKAIALRPGNRAQALSDQDFASLTEDLRFQQLLKKSRIEA